MLLFAKTLQTRKRTYKSAWHCALAPHPKTGLTSVSVLMSYQVLPFSLPFVVLFCVWPTAVWTTVHESLSSPHTCFPPFFFRHWVYIGSGHQLCEQHIIIYLKGQVHLHINMSLLNVLCLHSNTGVNGVFAHCGSVLSWWVCVCVSGFGYNVWAKRSHKNSLNLNRGRVHCVVFWKHFCAMCKVTLRTKLGTGNVLCEFFNYMFILGLVQYEYKY